MPRAFAAMGGQSWTGFDSTKRAPGWLNQALLERSIEVLPQSWGRVPFLFSLTVIGGHFPHFHFDIQMASYTLLGVWELVRPVQKTPFFHRSVPSSQTGPMRCLPSFSSQTQVFPALPAVSYPAALSPGFLSCPFPTRERPE